MKPDCTLIVERNTLSDWLFEWNLDQALGGREAPAAVDPLASDFRGEVPPAVGQIRLWPGGGPLDPPCLGFLLPAGYGTWWVLPFSRYAHPASPDEWRLRDEPPVRVLQGWNRRRVGTALAAASWLAGRISGEALFLATVFLQAIGDGGPMPPVLRSMIGPPLRHPLDPRHDYREQEWERVGHALGEAREVRQEADDLQWAAEPAAPFGGGVWQVPGENIRLVADEHELWIEPDGADWSGATLEADGFNIIVGPGKTACAGARKYFWRQIHLQGRSWPLFRVT
jgi:hypothetical protein